MCAVTHYRNGLGLAVKTFNGNDVLIIIDFLLLMYIQYVHLHVCNMA